MLLLALAGTSSATGTAAVAGLAGPDEAARLLDEARERGVLVQEDGVLAFRLPLLRSTVLQLATPAERRAAHAALADALPAGDRARTWHRAESTVGTDDRVADELERLAEADRHRLGQTPRPPRHWSAPRPSPTTTTWRPAADRCRPRRLRGR